MQKARKTQSRGTEAPEKQSKILFVIIGVLMALVVVLVVVVVYGFINPKQAGKTNDRPVMGSRGTVVNESNVQEVMDKLKEPVEDGYFKTKMNVDWTFQDGKATSENAYVANSADNSRTVYFDVLLADTEELVYSSPYMPVGTELQEVKLDENLEKGDYSAIVVYHLVDDQNEDLSTVSVAVNLHILN